MCAMIFKQEARASIEEKRSRFIGIGVPCCSLQEFQTTFDALKTEFATATHIAYAYRIREGDTLRIRANDAAEPSGTAGKPILNHLGGHDMINSVIFVARYFGGTKLGAGGLARAYGACAGATVRAAILIPFVIHKQLVIRIPYDQQNHTEKQLAELGAEILERTYTDCITLKLLIASEHEPSVERLNLITEAST